MQPLVSSRQLNRVQIAQVIVSSKDKPVVIVIVAYVAVSATDNARPLRAGASCAICGAMDDLRPPIATPCIKICVIDGDGIRGRDRSALPAPYDEIVRRQIATQELTVEAALRGDRRLAGEAFALDALAGRGDLGAMETMVDELLAGTAAWLPQFA